MAEQELSAFFNAVKQLFGPEQAEVAAEDWLRALIDTKDLPASTREWRLITAKVSNQLANRVNVSPLSTDSQMLRRKKICLFLSPEPQASLVPQ